MKKKAIYWNTFSSSLILAPCYPWWALRSKSCSRSQDVSRLTEGFPTTSSRVICNKKLSSTCEEFKFRGWYMYDAVFRLGQETHQILLKFQQTCWASHSLAPLTSWTGLWLRCSTSLLKFEKYLMRLFPKRKCCVILATKFKFIINNILF